MSIAVMLLIILICIVAIIAFFAYTFHIEKRIIQKLDISKINLDHQYNFTSAVNNIANDIKQLKGSINDIPVKTLNSITSSSSTYKGKLGELIGYMELHASYDRIIPLNTIADFIGIRLPAEQSEGTIDFVDIKNGPNAKLSKEQRLLKQLVVDKKIQFIQVKIESSLGKLDEDS